jgi:hypothetical protein
MEQIKPVTNTIKEYSENFHELYNSWKYVVEQDDVNINIKYMVMDNDKKWIEKQSIGINMICAKKLFKEITECIGRGEFTEDY